MFKFVKRCIHRINNSIRLKIIVIYSLSLLMVYIITWSVLSVFLFQPLESKQVQNMEYYMDRMINDSQIIKKNYENILYRLSNNHIIYQSLSDKCENYESVWEAITTIKYTLGEDMGRSSDIARLEVYQQGSDIGQDGKFIFSDNFDVAYMTQTNWALEEIDNAVYITRYQPVSSLYNGILAYIKIAVDMKKAFKDPIFYSDEINGITYLTNQDQWILASSNPEAFGHKMDEILETSVIEIKEGSILRLKDRYWLKRTIDEHWNIWLNIPSNQYENEINQAQVIAGIILLGYGLLLGVFLFFNLNRIFKRLHKLGDNMERIHRDMNYIQVPDKHDEVTMLELKYNGMIDTLETVVDEMAEVKILKQKFEFKCMESQINPHFLYNTLGIMRWEALESDNQKLAGLIDDLTSFYRLSLNKGKGTLTVAKEINLIKAYNNIQLARWNYVVDVVITMDESIQDVVIPKMILQPLVENSWLHGNIITKGNRKIRVSALEIKDRVVLEVWDNGDGIDQGIIDRFRKEDKADKNSFGIGIQFIKNILEYYYGDDYTYTVNSNMELGTLIQMCLPKEMDVMK